MDTNLTGSNSFNLDFQSAYKFTKHPPGKPIESAAKTIVMNVYTKLSKEKSEREVVEMTSRLTGVSSSSIYRIKDEYKSFGKFSTLGKKRPLKNQTQVRLQRYDEFTLHAIRRKIHEFFFRNEIPTAEKVKEAINSDEELPNFCVRTVRNIMKDLGFIYKKRQRKSILIERNDIQEWRRNYLRSIRKYRKEGRDIYYTDETWVNMGHTKSKIWQDTTIKSGKQAFISGLSAGLKSPSGKGSRFILVHAGNEEGFVLNACDIFQAKKIFGDYHGEMNGVYYEDWFKNKLLPNLKPNSIIVIDNAPYHSVYLEDVPKQSSRKADIQTWLDSKNIKWENDMLKSELLKIVSSVRKNYEMYKIDSIATQHGHIVLRLPPYHCELNPIETVWSQIKGYVAAENKTFKSEEVHKLMIEGINRVTVENWKNSVQHVLKEEEKMWELDNIMEQTVERVEFQVSLDESSTESE